jgi:hypothetical protein
MSANEKFTLDLENDNQVNEEEDEDDNSQVNKATQKKQYSKQNTTGQFLESKKGDKLSQKDKKNDNIVTHSGTHHVNFQTTKDEIAESKHESEQKPAHQSRPGNKGNYFL